jgi:hypothetical protein
MAMVNRLSSCQGRVAAVRGPPAQLGTGLSEVLQLPNKIKNNAARFRARTFSRRMARIRVAEANGRATVGALSLENGDRVTVTSRSWRSTGVSLLAIGTLGLTLSGCGMSVLTSGMGGGMFGGGTSSTGTPKRVTEETMLSSAKADNAGSTGGDGVARGCPRFQISSRDHHVTIYEPGRAGDGLGVMHRGEITRTARECHIEGNRVTVKYGFSGRILLGPRGRSGPISLPYRVSVLDPKRARIAGDRATVESNVSPDKPIAYFSQVRTVTFDVPEGARAGDIDVFVGFESDTPGAG